MHHATARFWKQYEDLPPEVRDLADRCFQLLKNDPRHPSLHLKRIGRYHSIRIGRHWRALGVDVPDGILWFWIGSHDAYNLMIGR